MNLSKLKRRDKVGVFLLVAFILSMSLIWLFEERFDKESWKTEPLERYQMVDDLIESQILLGKSKDEVKVLLGEPDFTGPASRELFLYNLGTPPSFFNNEKERLLIVFEQQSVVNVSLATD